MSDQAVVEMEGVALDFPVKSSGYLLLKELLTRRTKDKIHSKYYRALDDITLSINKGDVVGIVGPNQHLFGHIHRGVGRSRHQPLACEHHQRDQYGREASAHDRNHHRRTLEPFQGGMV